MGWAARRPEAEKVAERERASETAEARVRRLAAEYRAETDGRVAVVRHQRLAEAVRAMVRGDRARAGGPALATLAALTAGLTTQSGRER